MARYLVRMVLGISVARSEVRELKAPVSKAEMAALRAVSWEN